MPFDPDGPVEPLSPFCPVGPSFLELRSAYCLVANWEEVDGYWGEIGSLLKTVGLGERNEISPLNVAVLLVVRLLKMVVLPLTEREGVLEEVRSGRLDVEGEMMTLEREEEPETERLFCISVELLMLRDCWREVLERVIMFWLTWTFSETLVGWDIFTFLERVMEASLIRSESLTDRFWRTDVFLRTSKFSQTVTFFLNIVFSLIIISSLFLSILVYMI